MQATLATSTNGRILPVPDRQQELGERPFKLANHLPDHPLFTDARIRQMLRNVPREFIEIRAVKTSDDGNYRRGEMLTDVDPVEVFDRLAERPAWMLLHKSWLHDADLNALLLQMIAEFAEHCPEMRQELSDLGCWLFFSSGKSVVHFHSDPDQSFLSQVRGSKTVFVYPAKVLPEPVVEELILTQDQKSVVYDPTYEPAMFEPVHLSPGESVFLPLFAPHRVTNDDGVSVSINVGFHTPRSRKRDRVSRLNALLRRRGLRPWPYGRSPWTDSCKDLFIHGVKGLKGLVRRGHGTSGPEA